MKLQGNDESVHLCSRARDADTVSVLSGACLLSSLPPFRVLQQSTLPLFHDKYKDPSVSPFCWCLWWGKNKEAKEKRNRRERTIAHTYMLPTCTKRETTLSVKAQHWILEVCVANDPKAVPLWSPPFLAFPNGPPRICTRAHAFYCRGLLCQLLYSYGHLWQIRPVMLNELIYLRTGPSKTRIGSNHFKLTHNCSYWVRRWLRTESKK